MKVCIIDDDANLLKYYEMILKTIGVQYYLCKDEGELEIALQHSPDIFIVDIMLDDAYGPDVLERHFKEIVGKPVIMMSSSDHIAKIGMELRKKGINVIETMQKPISPKMLKSVLT